MLHRGPPLLVVPTCSKKLTNQKPSESKWGTFAWGIYVLRPPQTAPKKLT